MIKEDWVQVEIEDIFKKLENGKEINQGWSPQCKNYPSPSEDIWGVLKTTAIQKNEFWEHENKELPEDKEVRAHLEVKVGDIILTCAGPRNRCGVACTVIKTRPKLLLSGKMYRFRPDERAMTTEFLTFFLQTQESWLAIDKMKTGTSDSGLNLTHARFRKLPVRVAPLPEQRAIVTKIEELFSDLDKGIADLKKAQDQLKVYRQAVLKKAFEGELTNTKQKNKELPEGWKRETIREVCENVKVGIVIKPKSFYSESTNGIKAFRSANVREFRVNDTNWVYFSEEGNNINKRTQVHTGDVLIVRSGYPGTSCVIREKFNNTNAIDILIATPNQEKILPDFLCAFNNSPLGKGLFSKGSQGVAQKHLNVGVYGKLLISYPSIQEQHYILKEIESRLSVCDKVEQSITESLEKAKALRQSILKKAFEGTLLSAVEIVACKQQEDYEPATVLLEKIKAEKILLKTQVKKKK